MPFNPRYEDRLDRLTERLRLASAPTSDLISNIIAEDCARLPAMESAGKATRLNRLIEAGAWNDAALALIEIELPAWKLRRLVYEDGKWFCSLSKQAKMPASLDDTADASHEGLPLAILGAFLEARRRIIEAPESRSKIVPGVRPATEITVCCDNFA